MKPISKNTLLISALLGGSLALLSAGLYLRAVNTDAAEVTTEMPLMDMSRDMSTMHEKMKDDMPAMMMGEEITATEADVLTTQATMPEIMDEEMFMTEEDMPAGDFDQEISDEELAKIIKEISGDEELDLGLEMEPEETK